MMQTRRLISQEISDLAETAPPLAGQKARVTGQALPGALSREAR
jgi:hypothetical protein